MKNKQTNLNGPLSQTILEKRKQGQFNRSKSWGGRQETDHRKNRRNQKKSLRNGNWE
jgi:hypothetical protein